MANMNPASSNIQRATSKYGTSQGYFICKNPDKYIGPNKGKIPYHSSWEKDFMHTCDENPAIMQWAVEPFSIPYRDPVSGSKKNYWPDFLLSYMKKDGTMIHEIVEIKPLKESLLEKAKSRRDKANLLVNQAKWSAANQFCKANGLSFRIMTEQQLYGKK